MAKFDASTDRVWLNNGGTYYELKGQNSLSNSSQRGSMDSSDKAGWPYNTSVPGAISQSLSFDLMVDLPDANGFSRLETLFKSGAPELVQVRRNGSSANGTTDVIFQASMWVSGFDRTYNKGELRKVSVSMQLFAAPTIDLTA